MTKYVYSTSSNDNVYPLYGKPVVDGYPGDIIAQVLVKGKANVADKNLVTPKGVLTIVSDEEAEILRKSEGFQFHAKHGFVTIEDKKYEDIEAVATSLQGRDKSAPITPQDLELEGKKAHINKDGGKKP